MVQRIYIRYCHIKYINCKKKKKTPYDDFVFFFSYIYIKGGLKLGSLYGTNEPQNYPQNS